MLTDAMIRRMRAPETGQKDIADGTVKGLFLRLSHGGTRVFSFFYRSPRDGKPTRFRLGEYPGLGLSDARDKARACRALVDRGIDPRDDEEEKSKRAKAEAEEARRKERDTFGRRVDDYLASCRRRGLRTVAERERHFRVYLPADWRDRPLGSITRADVESVLLAIEERGPVIANRVTATLSAFFGWCAAKGFTATNPAANLKSDVPEVARDRALSDAELAAVWRASRSLTPVPGAFVRALILTGQRRGEVATMRWADIDLEQATWRIPAAMMKMNRQHFVPLAPMMLALLASLPRSAGFVFSTDNGATHWQAYSKAKARLDALLGDAVAPWRLHDLRRTVASGLARLNTAPHVIEKILAHDVTISGIALVYNKHQYLDERRAALTAWAEHVAGLVGETNVTALRRR